MDPLQRLAVASRRIADGHYAERVPTRSNDELGDLAASFNQMADALEATERRRPELIGDVAHELRTPIATLEGYLEGLLDGLVEPGPPTWARLHDEAGRLRRRVDDLQELSRAEARQIPLTIRPTDPADITRAAVDRLSPSFAEKGLDLHVDMPAGLPHVNADPDRAVQVLSNLLTNSLRYIEATGNSDLTLDEVMQFQWNGYAIVKEKSTGMGAFELLADARTGAVFPEMGPNMIWNTTYSPMASLGGGMMGSFGGITPGGIATPSPCGWERSKRAS